MADSDSNVIPVITGILATSSLRDVPPRSLRLPFNLLVTTPNASGILLLRRWLLVGHAPLLAIITDGFPAA